MSKSLNFGAWICLTQILCYFYFVSFLLTRDYKPLIINTTGFWVPKAQLTCYFLNCIKVAPRVLAPEHRTLTNCPYFCITRGMKAFMEERVCLKLKLVLKEQLLLLLNHLKNEESACSLSCRSASHSYPHPLYQSKGVCVYLHSH